MELGAGGRAGGWGVGLLGVDSGGGLLGGDSCVGPLGHLFSGGPRLRGHVAFLG